jgi:hypothetical protein
VTCTANCRALPLIISRSDREALHSPIKGASVECRVGQRGSGDGFGRTVEGSPFRARRFSRVEYVQDTREGDGDDGIGIGIDDTVLLRLDVGSDIVCLGRLEGGSVPYYQLGNVWVHTNGDYTVCTGSSNL